jgi:ASC-1-like (ASCH) protein
MSYLHKYIKYKLKYINLQAGGGFTISLKQPWFDLIKNNKKTVEGRLNKGMFLNLKKGDNITFTNENEKLNVKISDIRKYKSFMDMIETEGIDKVLPTIKTVEEGANIYNKYYLKTEQDKFGVLAIEISNNISGSRELKKIHNGKLQSPYYEYIRDGKKKYELRVYDEKRKQMNIGDEWFFEHNEKADLPRIRTIITDIKLYKTFEQAIKEGYKQLLPNANSEEEAVKIYNSFGDYEKESKIYGVVRFTLQV